MTDLIKLNEGVNNLCGEVAKYITTEQDKIQASDIDVKGLHDYVTHVDKDSEKRLIEGLSDLLPGSGFLVEENTVENTGEEYTWIVDPLDGTTNFIHSLPTFSISVALLRDDEIMMGTVYDVKSKECFYASAGNPSYCNGEEIRVSTRSSLADSLLATGFPYNDFSRQEKYLALLGHLMQHTRGIRRFGSAAIDLAWVACGRFDGFWEYSLKPWDVAAGSIIVRQAGGIVNDFKGGNDYLYGKEILCGNTHIQPELLKLAKNFFDE